MTWVDVTEGLSAELTVTCPLCGDDVLVDDLDSDMLRGATEVTVPCDCGGRLAVYVSADVRHESPTIPEAGGGDA